ncbi:polysaccharide deacetylase [Mucilaginibacter yixingensis]|uniref:Polysaccharide deacetylase n=1 Tax=Mucilaginibacter yixingensis TaxID=1295612 RepID=A0A2T5JAR3_9SPHI|nr:polysaccharide deacetylase family protein [Mucilaginibacter yixingensis]PTQ97879.1 polysaccharide deacetylase [Mucilaginibacter yixingensis]
MNKTLFLLLTASVGSLCLTNHSALAAPFRLHLPQDTSGKTVVQQPEKIRVAKFKNDKVCAISYTFDDGLQEHYTLVTPRLRKLGLKGTFVINGSIINPDKNHLKDTTRMSWDELKEMAAAGQEISNHGWAHKNLGKFPLDVIKEDILKNDSAIYANIGIKPTTYAYPNNTKKEDGVKFASLNRVGTRTFQRSLGGHSNPDELDKWVDKLLADHDWGVTMTHGITYGYDCFKSPEVLWNHLEKVQKMQDKIWVGTFHDVSAYVKERDSTVLNIKQMGKGHYQLMAICPLDKKLFTEPLTAVFEDTDARKYEAWQGKKKLNVKVKPNQLIFDFDPFGGVVDIKRK